MTRARTRPPFRLAWWLTIALYPAGMGALAFTVAFAFLTLIGAV